MKVSWKTGVGATLRAFSYYSSQLHSFVRFLLVFNFSYNCVKFSKSYALFDPPVLATLPQPCVIDETDDFWYCRAKNLNIAFSLQTLLSSLTFLKLMSQNILSTVIFLERESLDADVRTWLSGSCTVHVAVYTLLTWFLSYDWSLVEQKQLWLKINESGVLH